MKKFLIGILKLMLWVLAFPVMLIYALLKEKKLLITVLCIVFLPIAIIIMVLREAVIHTK